MGSGRQWAWNSSEIKVDRGDLLGVNLDSPSTEPVLEGIEVPLEVEGCYCGVWLGRQQSSVIG